MKNVLIEIKNEIPIITIVREKYLNALNMQTLSDLDEILDDINGAKCCVITGAGMKAFVAGADITEMEDMTESEFISFCEMGNKLFNRLMSSDTINIAAINGYALGGGNELAMACDIRIAAQNAKFSQPEINLGIIPGFGGSQRLPVFINQSLALEMLLTGKRLDADEALKAGLVNRVVPQDILIEETLILAKKIIKNNPITIRNAKKAIYERRRESLEKSIKYETELNGQCFATKERKTLMSNALKK